MTQKQFNKKIRNLARSSHKTLLEFARAALKSGAFDLKAAPDDWRLVKNVMTAACESAAWQWRPMGGRGDTKEIKNIQALTYPDYTGCSN